MAVFFQIAWVNLVAVIGVVTALAPLLGRRRPVGTRSVRHEAARVIPFASHKRAQSQ